MKLHWTTFLAVTVAILTFALILRTSPPLRDYFGEGEGEGDAAAAAAAADPTAETADDATQSPLPLPLKPAKSPKGAKKGAKGTTTTTKTPKPAKTRPNKATTKIGGGSGSGSGVSSVKVNAVTPADLAAAPKVYLGSAWPRAMLDLTNNPDDWPTARAQAGYFLQPMGFKWMKGKMPTLLNHFDRKFFVNVESLGKAKLGQDLLINASKATEYAPDMKCAGMALYVAPAWLEQKYDDAVATFKAWAQPAKKLGIPVYFFTTPVNGGPEGPTYKKFLMTPKRGKPMWVDFCKATGAAGVAVDYPSAHWMASDKMPWNRAGFRDVAVHMAKTTQKAGLKFIWCLNGVTESLDLIHAFARDMAAKGIKPDQWWVNHFNPIRRKIPGTPETEPTPSGIAAALIQGKY